MVLIDFGKPKTFELEQSKPRMISVNRFSARMIESKMIIEDNGRAPNPIEVQ